MTVLTVLGARPQFIKSAPVSRELRRHGLREWVLHTGQHYDPSMSAVFFEEHGLDEPRWNLAVGSGPPGWQVAEMLMGVEAAIQETEPDWVLVYGDTNSTLAGALAAIKQGVPLAHVEAGVRSYNLDMPEEHNRVLTDRCATLRLCPNEAAVANLAAEGIRDGVHVVGDPMLAAMLALDVGPSPRADTYAVATIHRPYNTDDPEVLSQLVEALAALPFPVVFPVHPRTRARLGGLPDSVCARLASSGVQLVEPMGQRALLSLVRGAQVVLTDSGGLQREAYWLGVPCVTLRPETEWAETASEGWNVLAREPAAILAAATRARPQTPPQTGPTDAHVRIVEHLRARS